MHRPFKHPWYLASLLAVFALAQASAFAVETEDDARDQEVLPLAKKKKKKKKKSKQFETDYRYDWDQRHFSFGLNLGGGLGAGNTLNAFRYGGVITPYLKAAFGDGNSIQFDVTVGYQSHCQLSADVCKEEAAWLYFRTPIMPDSASGGYLVMVAPNLQFRYEVEMGSSISKRSPVLVWGGMGFGSVITNGFAELIDNGTDADPELRNTELTNLEIFFDILPTAGLRFRLGEFAYFETGFRLHLMLPIASMVTDQDQLTVGKPTVLPEFYIGKARWLDYSIGFAYDFM